MAKKISTTRNTTFNYYVDGNTYKSIASISASSKIRNIDLLEYNAPIKVTGKQINSDAAKNTTYQELSYKGNAKSSMLSSIDTGIDTYEESDVFTIYGSPHKWVFDNRQQYNNCGVVCCMNILVMAGKLTIDNQNKTEYTFTHNLWSQTDSPVEDDEPYKSFGPEDGGTSLSSIKEILKDYSVDAEVWSTDPDEDNTFVDALKMDELVSVIKQGGAAVIAVDSQVMCYGRADEPSFNHAILVTGVVYDTTDGEDNTVRGFYIHDSGVWMTRFISVNELKKISFYDETDGEYKTEQGFFCTVVRDIKSMTKNTNATGNNYANIINGNSADNIIKGKGGNDTLNGNGGNDTIYGDGGKDIISGGNGDDELHGGSGNDTIYGDSGIDTIYGDSGNDTIYGGLGNDILYGGSGNDTIFGNEGEDAIEGNNGNDTIYGGDGVDTIYGGNGNDKIYGEVGDDYIEGNNGNDTIYGGEGSDTIYGGSGNDKLYGDAGDDVIYGDNGNDTIYGGDGADKIFGGKGNDYIYGEAGNDIIDCGAGNDHVYIDNSSGVDIVTSLSGSVTFHFDDILAKDIKYSVDENDINIGYDESNYISYSDFYNTETNKCQTAYIVDENLSGKTTKYRLSVNGSEGNIKVGTTKGNNILYTLDNINNVITTSKYADVVFMNSGNDTITYTGGKDYYSSTDGNDIYNVKLFNKNTNLTINDTSTLSDNDAININSNKKYVSLLFDVTSNGKVNDNGDLILFNNSAIKKVSNFQNIIAGNSNGIVTISDYFESNSKFSEGAGYIDTISAKSGRVYSALDIDSAISSIVGQVSAWLDGKEYSSVFDAIQKNAEGVSELIAIYRTTAIDYIPTQNS